MNIIQIGPGHEKDHVYDFCEKVKDSITKIILVDASPECIEASTDNYSDFENVEFINAAVTNDDVESVAFYRPIDDPCSGHSSLSEHHVIVHKHPELDKIIVPAIKIDSLFDKFDSRVIDRLYIDTEGYDVKIIQQIDFNNIVIPYIRFEFVHSDGPFTNGEQLDNTIIRLKALGYIVVRDGEYDLVCILK